MINIKLDEAIIAIINNLPGHFLTLVLCVIGSYVIIFFLAKWLIVGKDREIKRLVSERNRWQDLALSLQGKDAGRRSSEPDNDDDTEDNDED